MDKRNTCILIIIILVIGGAVYGFSRIKKEDTEETFFEEIDLNIISLEDEIIDSVSKNLDTLSREKAVLGGKWYVTRFGLIDKDHLYVEYEDGHIARRMLIEKDGTDWKVIAFFEPGKDMWQLVYGEDDYMDADLSIYKQSDDLSWELVK